MNFIELHIPRLKTSPNQEMGVIVNTWSIRTEIVPPTLVELREGNRRVIEATGDPILINALKRVGRSGRVSGTYVRKYNSAFIKPTDNPREREYIIYHENGHAVGYFLKANEDACSNDFFEDDQFTEVSPENREVSFNYARKCHNEGFAEWIAYATALRLQQRTEIAELEEHGKFVGESLRKSLLEADKGDYFLVPYSHGHRLVFLAMIHLTKVRGLPFFEALKLVSNTIPTSMEEVLEKVPKKYMGRLLARQLFRSG